MTCSFGCVEKRGPSRSNEDLSPLRASKTCAVSFASAILITRLPDLDDGVLAAGHAAAHPELVVVGIHGHDLDVAHRGRLVAHLSRHLLALEDSGRVSGSPDGAWLPDVVGAVAHRAAGETVTLDGPLEAFALGGGAYVDLVADLEDVGADALAHLTAHAPQLLEVLARRRFQPGERAGPGLVDPAGFDRAKADLYGRVAVLLGGADRRDQVRLDLDDGHADERAIVLEGLGHLLFASVHCGCHSPKLPLSLCSRRKAGRAARGSPCACRDPGSPCSGCAWSEAGWGRIRRPPSARPSRLSSGRSCL